LKKREDDTPPFGDEHPRQGGEANREVPRLAKRHGKPCRKRYACELDETAFREGHQLVGANDDVVQNPHIDKPQG